MATAQIIVESQSPCHLSIFIDDKNYCYSIGVDDQRKFFQILRHSTGRAINFIKQFERII